MYYSSFIHLFIFKFSFGLINPFKANLTFEIHHILFAACHTSSLIPFTIPSLIFYSVSPRHSSAHLFCCQAFTHPLIIGSLPFETSGESVCLLVGRDGWSVCQNFPEIGREVTLAIGALFKSNFILPCSTRHQNCFSCSRHCHWKGSLKHTQLSSHSTGCPKILLMLLYHLLPRRTRKTRHPYRVSRNPSLSAVIAT